jgi:hypothetical protein
MQDVCESALCKKKALDQRFGHFIVGLGFLRKPLASIILATALTTSGSE